MSVLLLDAAWQPLAVITRGRLAVLLSKERVACVRDDAEAAVALAAAERRLPEGVVVVRLLRAVRVPPKMIRATRANLLLRDNSTCQYCGAQPSARDLTIDHVVPQCQGGSRTSWDNLVIACRRCNHRKGGRRPHEAGMRLRRHPVALRVEYATVLFLRHPELKLAYENAIGVAA